MPAQGFAYLQGNDGNIRKFCINSIAVETSLFPRAHTCFNRIDLPLYTTKQMLKDKLTLAVQMEATGFGESSPRERSDKRGAKRARAEKNGFYKTCLGPTPIILARNDPAANVAAISNVTNHLLLCELASLVADID